MQCNLKRNDEVSDMLLNLALEEEPLSIVIEIIFYFILFCFHYFKIVVLFMYRNLMNQMKQA